MDPISLLFSAYLTSMQNQIYNGLASSMGLETQAVHMEYEGQTIPYQYRLWKVDNRSVCATSRNKIDDYARCTQSAQRLFVDLCNGLSKKPGGGPTYVRAKNMYCNAVIDFKPTTASLVAGSAESEIVTAKKDCNAATLKAMGSGDLRLHQAREKACGRYRELKAAR